MINEFYFDSILLVNYDSYDSLRRLEAGIHQASRFRNDRREAGYAPHIERRRLTKYFLSLGPGRFSS